MPTAPEPSEQVAAIGFTMAALASTPDERDMLDAFADLLDVGPEVLGPLLLIVLFEPLAGAQFAPAGHACPGLAFRVDADLDLRVVFPDEVQFYDSDTDTYTSAPPQRTPPPDPPPGWQPTPVPGNVAALGATLTSLTSATSIDRRHLQMAADVLHQAAVQTSPFLVTVLVQAVDGAQIRLTTDVRPGTSIRIDDELQVRVHVPGGTGRDPLVG
jgi:hypothetical protein